MAMLCCSTPSTTSFLSPSKSFPTFKTFTSTLVSIPQLSFSPHTTHQLLHCSNINSTSPIESPHAIIFIKGLPVSTTEGHLKKTFMQFGEVSRVKIVVDENTKQALGYAYIWFENEKSAQLAVKEMDGKFFDGRFIYVKMSKPGSCKPTRKEIPPFKF